MGDAIPIRRPGNQKCPKCGDESKNKQSKSLSVKLEGEVMLWKCHRCNWTGRHSPEAYNRPAKVQYTKPKVKPTGNLDAKAIEWFSIRGIPQDVLIRNRIEVGTARFGDTRDTRAILFPYYRGGELVNVKYRGPEKQFRMESGAELTMYGLDDIDPRCVYLVEGEIDKLSLETVGFKSCLSVPNGAGTNLDILGAVEHLLDPVKKFVLAGDADAPGQELQAKLIRRLGPERCWRATWPDGYKDANDVLGDFGGIRLREILEAATPIPIEGAFGLSELLPELELLWRYGRPKGVYCGWPGLAEFFKPRLGQWTVITGTPNAGKSSFCRALLINLAQLHDWKFVVFPPEDCPPEEYWSLLLELYLAKPFNPGPSERMTWDEAYDASKWIDEHFVILNPLDGQRDFDHLVTLARAYVLRRGINGFVIDPWNRVEHGYREQNQTMTQYIEQSLVKLSSLTKTYQLHNIVVAHPTKPQKDKDGKYRLPTLYDISDSAAWHNMSDFGIVVWRNKEDAEAAVQIHVQKVRSRWCGNLGTAELFYDKVTGRYADRTQPGGVLPFRDNNDEYEEIQ